MASVSRSKARCHPISRLCIVLNLRLFLQLRLRECWIKIQRSFRSSSPVAFFLTHHITCVWPLDHLISASPVLFVDSALEHFHPSSELRTCFTHLDSRRVAQMRLLEFWLKCTSHYASPLCVSCSLTWQLCLCFCLLLWSVLCNVCSDTETTIMQH